MGQQQQKQKIPKKRMQKQASTKNKQNLNISCISQLQSSLLSSVNGEKQIKQSIQKITQLKDIYKQTLLQSQELQKEKNVLMTKLAELKNKMEQIIEYKFKGMSYSNSKMHEEQNKQAKNLKIYRPGSINKINQSCRRSSKVNSVQSINAPMQNKQDVQLGHLQEKNGENANQLHLNLRGDMFSCRENKEHKIVSNTQKIASFNIWEDNKLKFQNDTQENKTQIKKSYLGSPRGNSLMSPRSFIAA